MVKCNLSFLYHESKLSFIPHSIVTNPCSIGVKLEISQFNTFFRYVTEVKSDLVCGKTTDVFISAAHYAEQWMYDTLIKQFWSQGDM